MRRTFPRTAMGTEPILSLDTSAINKLAGDVDSECLILGLTSAFSIRLTFTSVNEVAATSRCGDRSILIEVCKRLRASGDFLLPVGELLEKLIRAFEDGASPFEWSTVGVSLEKTVDAAFRSSDIGDDTSDAVRQEARTMKQRFEGVLDKAKPSFSKVSAMSLAAAGRSPSDLVSGLQRGGQYWKIASRLYEGITGHLPHTPTVQTLEHLCPPFRCVAVALCVALFDRCVRPPNTQGSLRAGWADTFMAAYLPYCDQFVTADERQLSCYREIASLCDLNVKIRSYNDLRRCLCLG